MLFCLSEMKMLELACVFRRSERKRCSHSGSRTLLRDVLSITCSTRLWPCGYLCTLLEQLKGAVSSQWMEISVFQHVHSQKSCSIINSVTAFQLSQLYCFLTTQLSSFNGITDYISYKSKFYLTLWPNLLISQIKFNCLTEQQSPNIC